MPEVHLKYDIDGADFSAAGEASGAMKKALRQMGIASDIIRRCAVCMYEGEINAVIHGGGGKADVFISPERVLIVIEDYGPGIADVEAAMREGFSTASSRIRELGFGAGMGLPNMDRYSDSMEIETAVGKGTKITMTINL
jgi:Anti-sigma regulatory factor (Ser/Thr protein kinase)